MTRKGKPLTGDGSSDRHESGEEERAVISGMLHQAEINPTREIVERLTDFYRFQPDTVCSDEGLNPDADPHCATFGLRRHEAKRQVLERSPVRVARTFERRDLSAVARP